MKTIHSNKISRIFPTLLIALSPHLSGHESDAALSLHGSLRSAAGLSSGNPADLATNEHDPQQDVSLQYFELSLLAKLTNSLHIQSTGVLLQTADDEFDVELEELFLNWTGTGFAEGLAFKGGRFFNDFGIENINHSHSSDFVNSNLSTGTFLGEEGISVDGVELSYFREVGKTLFGLTAAFGEVNLHSEEEDEEEGHDEAEEFAELGFFAENAFSLRAIAKHQINDYHSHRIGANFARGTNGFDRDTDVYALDYTYQWRENGYHTGGRSFMLNAEVYYRDIENRDEDNPSDFDSFSQWGAQLSARYEFNQNWALASRYGLIEGVTGFQDNRERFSVSLTHLDALANNVSSHARIQYSHDELGGGQAEDSVWLQIGFDFGLE